MKKNGQAFLALVLLIGVFLVLTAASLIFIINTFVDTSYGNQDALQAQAAAMGGAEDALLRLVRNAAFSSAGYTLAVGSSTATITVTQNSPVANEDTILSTATVFGRTRKINVVVSENAITGQIVKVSWANVP